MNIFFIGLTCSILLLSNEGSCSDNFSGSVDKLFYFHDLKFLHYCEQLKKR